MSRSLCLSPPSVIIMVARPSPGFTVLPPVSLNVITAHLLDLWSLCLLLVILLLILLPLISRPRLVAFPLPPRMLVLSALSVQDSWQLFPTSTAPPFCDLYWFCLHLPINTSCILHQEPVLCHRSNCTS